MGLFGTKIKQFPDGTFKEFHPAAIVRKPDGTPAYYLVFKSNRRQVVQTQFDDLVILTPEEWFDYVNSGRIQMFDVRDGQVVVSYTEAEKQALMGVRRGLSLITDTDKYWENEVTFTDFGDFARKGSVSIGISTAYSMSVLGRSMCVMMASVTGEAVLHQGNIQALFGQGCIKAIPNAKGFYMCSIVPELFAKQISSIKAPLSINMDVLTGDNIFGAAAPFGFKAATREQVTEAAQMIEECAIERAKKLACYQIADGYSRYLLGIGPNSRTFQASDAKTDDPHSGITRLNLGD